MTLFQRIFVVAALQAVVVVMIAVPGARVAIGLSVANFSLPLALGVAHNSTAALLWLAVVFGLFLLSYRRRDA